MAPNWSVGRRWLTGAHLFVGCGGWLAPGSLWQVADRLWSVFTLCVHVVRAFLFAFCVASTLSLRTCRAQMNFDALHATRALGRCRGAGQPRPLIAVRASLPPAPRAAVPAMPKVASVPATPRKSSAPASPPKGVMPTAAGEKISQSMDAQERFHQKSLEYVKCCIHARHGTPLASISLDRFSKHVSVDGQIVVRTCQRGSLKNHKYQDIESEAEEQMEK